MPKFGIKVESGERLKSGGLPVVEEHEQGVHGSRNRRASCLIEEESFWFSFCVFGTLKCPSPFVHTNFRDWSKQGL